MTDQQTIAETFNEYFVAIAENVKRQNINNLINDNNNSTDNHTHFMEQAFHKPTQLRNVNAQQRKKLNTI